MILARAFRPVLALFLALLVASCGTLRRPEPPSVYLTDLRFLESGLFEQRFLLALRVTNPNPYELPLKGLRFALGLNGREFAEGLSDQAVTIPALGQEIVTVEASTNIIEMMQQILLLARRSELSYEIDGEAFLGGTLGRSVPFSREGKLRLQPEPEPGRDGAPEQHETLIPL